MNVDGNFDVVPTIEKIPDILGFGLRESTRASVCITARVRAWTDVIKSKHKLIVTVEIYTYAHDAVVAASLWRVKVLIFPYVMKFSRTVEETTDLLVPIEVNYWDKKYGSVCKQVNGLWVIMNVLVKQFEVGVDTHRLGG